jgi:hypothetical protein
MVATIDTGRGTDVRAEGFGFIPLRMTGGRSNPLKELLVIVQLARMYRKVRPDIIHHVTIKPVIYGSLAARFVPSASVVNAVSGLGYTFSHAWRARVAKPLVQKLYRVAMKRNHTKVIFQNPDDLGLFVSRRIVDRTNAVLIRGSGVDCSVFVPVPEPNGMPLVILPARLLRDKGITEFVKAAAIVNRRGRRRRRGARHGLAQRRAVGRVRHRRRRHAGAPALPRQLWWWRGWTCPGRSRGSARCWRGWSRTRAS